MTMLWKQDPFHKEWDFMCAVYSAIREFLSDENISLQNWIQFSTKHLGIVVRDSYLTSLGWELIQLEDGTHMVDRTAIRTVQSYVQPTNGLGLFMNCLNDGLPVSNPLPIIAKLSDLANDIICINTQLGAAAKPTNTMDGFRQLAKNNPQLAMSALFQVDVAHPLITQGVSVHHVPNGLPAAEPFFMVQNEDPELDAMLEKIFRGDGDGSFNNQPNLGNQYYGMGMENGTPGQSTDQPDLPAQMLTNHRLQLRRPICCTRPDRTAEEPTRPQPKRGTNTCGMAGIAWQSDSHRHLPGAALRERELTGMQGPRHLPAPC
jgi:hypothetical protein